MMNACSFRSVRHQNGFVSIVAAIILIAAIIVILNQSLGIVTNTTNANQSQEDSGAAFFLAESGVERARADILTALNGGSYDANYCTTASNWPEQSLGRGKFQYLLNSTFNNVCTCSGGACAGANCIECNVTVKGVVNSSARTIRARISTASNDGAGGCGSTAVLPLETTESNTAVFTNLAYRAHDDGSISCNPGHGSSNAQVGSCDYTIVSTGLPSGDTCDPTLYGWNLQRTGNTNVSGMGVVTTVTNPAVYTITQNLVTSGNTGVPAPRNYVQVGVRLGPVTGSGVPATLVGSYGSDTGSNRTTGVSGGVGAGGNVPGQTSGNPKAWNCALTNGEEPSSTLAASANTLLYGLSSWPQTSPFGTANAVTFGSQPLGRLVEMVGTQGDNLYSQIWYSFNKAYDPAVSNANAGAAFTGTIGAGFKGHTNPARTRLILDTDLGTNEVLSVGDLVKNSAGTTIYGTLGSLAAGTAGQNNAQYNYTDTSTTDLGSNTVLTAYSALMRLGSAATPVALASGDNITNSAGTIAYGKISGACTGNIVGATCPLSAAANVSSAVLHAARAAIALTGALMSPSPGTALAVTTSSTTGILTPTVILSGSISGTTLTTSTSVTLYHGDALFGDTVKPNTTVNLVGGIGSSFTGTSFPVTPSQTGGAANMLARTAVVQVTTANAITASRPVYLFGAGICGGVCAFLNHSVGGSYVDTVFTLNNLGSSDDWASGFACVKGVDPDKIRKLGAISVTRSGWTEIVQ